MYDLYIYIALISIAHRSIRSILSLPSLSLCPSSPGKNAAVRPSESGAYGGVPVGGVRGAERGGYLGVREGRQEGLLVVHDGLDARQIGPVDLAAMNHRILLKNQLHACHILTVQSVDVGGNAGGALALPALRLGVNHALQLGPEIMQRVHVDDLQGTVDRDRLKTQRRAAFSQAQTTTAV